MATKQKTPQSKLANLPENAKIEDITNALKEDHEVLRKFGEVLKSEDASLSEKKTAYKNFSSLLKSHAKSEEKAVYEKCLKVDDLEQEAEEGYVEHQIADTLMKKLETTQNKEKWQAMAKVLAEVVEHHADEEEKELLPEVKKEFESDERQEMTRQFLTLRERSQKGVNEENAGVLAQFSESISQKSM